MPELKQGRFKEWPTLALLVLCYGLWGLGTTWLAGVSLPLAIVLVIFSTTLHSSLTHEMLHGHPFRSPVANATLVYPALSLVVPYLRFKDTHIAHHEDSRLTDPYDDPESNFMDPAVWVMLPTWCRAILRVNNTLAGRMLMGPLLGTLAFVRADWSAIRHGDARVLQGWLLHAPAVALVVWWMMSVAQMPIWIWLASTYAALSILKIRTFLEHRAHTDAMGRTVIIEDRGLLALLFLNNNLHVVHHQNAKAPWYDLPRLYRHDRESYLRGNDNYRFRSYREVFLRYFLKAKDPVPHPLWPKR